MEGLGGLGRLGGLGEHYYHLGGLVSFWILFCTFAFVINYFQKNVSDFSYYFYCFCNT